MQTKRLNRVCFITATPEQKTQHQALIAAPGIRICAVRHRQKARPANDPLLIGTMQNPSGDRATLISPARHFLNHAEYGSTQFGVFDLRKCSHKC